MVMEPVRGGRLSSLSPAAEKVLKEARADWSMASRALHWVKRLPQVQVVLSGMSTMEQIRENVSTFSDGYALAAEEEKDLFYACELFKKQVSVPCTACRYCCDGCPAQIEIPKFLALYNSYKIFLLGIRFGGEACRQSWKYSLKAMIFRERQSFRSVHMQEVIYLGRKALTFQYFPMQC